jgi:RecB family exonuclease
LTAWSFSRLYTYRRCPAWFRYQNILKIPQPPVPAMERGSELHKRLEVYIKDPAKRRLPTTFKLIAPTMKKIAKLNPRAELELAFDPAWKRVDWFAPTVALRIKIDLLYHSGPDTLCIVDYKSGRINPEAHQEQLRLYKLAALLTEAKAVQAITTGVWYIDHESVPRLLSTTIAPAFAATLKDEQKYWTAQSAKLVRDKQFRPNPGHACAWCPYSYKKTLLTGGPGPCLKAI